MFKASDNGYMNPYSFIAYLRDTQGILNSEKEIQATIKIFTHCNIKIKTCKFTK